MTGNVDEWCSDWRGDGYYEHMSTDDPQGPHNGTMKIVKGASFGYEEQNVSPALHTFSYPYWKHDQTGFRLARD